MNKLKNTLIVILTAGLLITAYFAWYYHGQKNTAETKTVKNQKTVELAANIISRMVDSSGRNHATISATGNMIANDWYKNGTAIKGGFIDTVARALNIKSKKQLEEVTQISIKNEAQALKAERMVDSLQRLTYFYKGKYMQLAYRPPVNKTDSTDHGQFDYRYNDSITVAQYWKKNGCWGLRKAMSIFTRTILMLRSTALSAWW